MSQLSSLAHGVIMMRPATFGFNPETAASNAFQRLHHGEGLATQALREFDEMAAALTHAGIHVEIWADTPTPQKPDAVFLNNWISTHANGRVYVYPMAAVNRRAEVRFDLVERLQRDYFVTEVVDWSGLATREQFLEGTGSLVVSATSRRVFACRSSRTDEQLVRQWAEREGYEPVIFHAFDAGGRSIYHTNVVLCFGVGFAACGLGFVAEEQRFRLGELLREAGELVELDAAQIESFAGNMLQLVRADGSPVLVLSQTALRAFRSDQLRVLEQRTELLPIAIPTIEAAGGGSARCMLAERFLNPR